MPTKTVFITSGTTFTVPLDFGSIVSIEAIGGASRGGGAYAKSTSVTGLIAGATAYCNVAAGFINTAGDTWFNVSAATAPSSATDGVRAKGGTSTTGGAAASCVGDVAYSGGNKGSGTSSYAGGGAAGPLGSGTNGGANYTGTSIVTGGGGGAAGGAGSAGADGTSTAAGSGAAGPGGSGGGGATNSTDASAPTAGGGGGGGGAYNNIDTSTYRSNTKGAMLNTWLDEFGTYAGPAGGAGGEADSTVQEIGTNYGGGGSNAAGGQGIIVFTYNVAPPGNFLMVF